MRNTVILFDINETVLNLSPLRPKFNRYFGDETHMDTWFAMLLHSSTVCIATKTKTDFKSLSRTALQSLAGRMSVALNEQELDDLLSTFANLPAHNDILPALTRLRSAGFKLVAFSNSSKSLLDSQLGHANVIGLFDKVISVQEAQTFKPAPEAYQFAAYTLGIEVSEACLVATHDWDTHGALSAGLTAAFIDRFNSPYNSLYIKPTIVGATMENIADQLIAQLS